MLVVLLTTGAVMLPVPRLEAVAAAVIGAGGDHAGVGDRQAEVGRGMAGGLDQEAVAHPGRSRRGDRQAHVGRAHRAAVGHPGQA
jgi:hypothetical protein